ncbi:hypothetical protein ES705_05110 [subsurface metagenome]
MKKKSFNTIQHTLVRVCIILLSTISCNMHMDVPGQPADQSKFSVENDSFVIGESIACKNLQIIPLIGNETLENQEYMILSEVIRHKDVVVEETGNVNQLSISNNTDDYIFILAGDILKGGKQDRTIGYDVIIPPHTKHVPLESFCVESGRWQKRGHEEVNKFSDNTKMLSSRDLKLASRYEKNQSAVWRKVSEKQDKLNKNLAEMKGEDVDVRSDESGTSLQLTLESKELVEVINEYKNELKELNDLPDNTIGFAYAINGQIYGMDIYLNSNLFSKLQFRLFDAIIAEAISEHEKDSSFVAAKAEMVNEIIQKLSACEARESRVNEHTMERVYEADDAVMFETIDMTQGQTWVRKNYISKGDYDAGFGQDDQELIQRR